MVQNKARAVRVYQITQLSLMSGVCHYSCFGRLTHGRCIISVGQYCYFKSKLGFSQSQLSLFKLLYSLFRNSVFLIIKFALVSIDFASAILKTGIQCDHYPNLFSVGSREVSHGNSVISKLNCDSLSAPSLLYLKIRGLWGKK